MFFDAFRLALTLTVLSLGTLLLLQDDLAAQDQSRRALVIGVDTQLRPQDTLRNARNDAIEFGKKLSEPGLDFTTVIKQDLTRTEMYDQLDDLANKMTNGGVAVFFFAGHGMQRDGHNWLVPKNAVIDDESQIASAAFDTQDIFRAMQGAGNAATIVFLDACRNNPFERRLVSSIRSSASPIASRSFSAAPDGPSPAPPAASNTGLTLQNTAGLVQLYPPSGILIAYATSPGKTASDDAGPGQSNGLYTSALLHRIMKPGVTITDVLQEVAGEVSDRSGGAQQPWYDTSFRRYVVLRGILTDDELDDAAYDNAKFIADQTRPPASKCRTIRMYVDEFPGGRHIIEAQQYIRNNCPAVVATASSEFATANAAARSSIATAASKLVPEQKSVTGFAQTGARLHWLPSEAAPLVALVDRGERLRVSRSPEETSPGWLAATNPRGITGFVPADRIARSNDLVVKVAFDGAKLNAHSIGELRNASKKLDRAAIEQIEVTAFASAANQPEYRATRVAYVRAMEIQAQLIGLGLPPEKIAAQFKTLPSAELNENMAEIVIRRLASPPN